MQLGPSQLGCKSWLKPMICWEVLDLECSASLAIALFCRAEIMQTPHGSSKGGVHCGSLLTLFSYVMTFLIADYQNDREQILLCC